jgi:hypothetical protein
VGRWRGEEQEVSLKKKKMLAGEQNLAVMETQKPREA